MSLEDFIIFVFCLVDDQSKILNIPTGQRGPAPKLSASEVLTMEIVGEFLELYEDTKIWLYFKTSWIHFFPNIGSRTSFARRSANLMNYKQLLWQRILTFFSSVKQEYFITDGFPIYVAKITRANRAKLFRENEADIGYCAAKDERYYGLKCHLVTENSGLIRAFTITSATTDERKVIPNLYGEIKGMLLGDKGLIDENKQEDHLENGIDMQYLKRKNMLELRSRLFVERIKKTRRRIETVIGQLTERFHIEKSKARDMWHLRVRILRKVLSHTVAVYVAYKKGLPPLQFSKILKI